MGTLATSVNATNTQTSNHSKSTLIPLFQKLVVMLIELVLFILFYFLLLFLIRVRRNIKVCCEKQGSNARSAIDLKSAMNIKKELIFGHPRGKVGDGSG
jgi:preprotein translocase subunit SecY